eukprot:4260351-Pleurochrysis_carterae.AAC.2
MAFIQVSRSTQPKEPFLETFDVDFLASMRRPARPLLHTVSKSGHMNLYEGPTCNQADRFSWTPSRASDAADAAQVRLGYIKPVVY